MTHEILDQDEFALRSIVWYGAGEVVGNRVTVSIRDFDGAFMWFIRVESALGHTMVGAGVEGSFDASAAAIVRTVRAMLEADAEE